MREYIGLIGIMLMVSIGLTIINLIVANEHRIHTRTLNQYEQLERFRNTKTAPKWRKVLPSETQID